LRVLPRASAGSVAAARDRSLCGHPLPAFVPISRVRSQATGGGFALPRGDRASAQSSPSARLLAPSSRRSVSGRAAEPTPSLHCGRGRHPRGGCALVILARGGAIGCPAGATGLPVPASWAIAEFLVLNTLGNLASTSRLKRTVFFGDHCGLGCAQHLRRAALTGIRSAVEPPGFALAWPSAVACWPVATGACVTSFRSAHCDSNHYPNS